MGSTKRMEYDCIVIGAGMAGLTCALKLAAKGKKVLVLEKQPVAGGVATNFKRKGFTFESSLHFVDALAPGGEIREFLDEYCVSPKIDFIELKEFGRIIYPEHDFVVKGDFDALKARLKQDFPHEEKGIDGFFQDIHKFYRSLDGFSNSRLPLWLNLLVSPILHPGVIKASCLTLEQFINKRIEDKRLRAILGTIWGFIGVAPSEVSAFYFLIVLRGYWGAKTAFMKGGYNSLFKAMVERIRELGSEIKFNTTVAQIITEGGRRASSVRTDKGEEFKAKVIVSNANAIDTLTRLIDCSALREFYAQKLSSMRKSTSAAILYLGLDVPAASLGMGSFLLSIHNSYDHDDNTRRSLLGDYAGCSLAVVDHSQLDPGLAPAGKSNICVMTFDSYANWNTLSQDEYNKKKKEMAGAILANLEKHLPGISAHIEVMETATPMTLKRFGSVPEGTIYGFAQTVAQSSINRLAQDTKIKGLFLAGAWTRPGCGVHGCLVSGKDAADLAGKIL